MASRTGTAHVVTTTRKYKDKVYRTHLLRRSYREDGKVKNETLGNLSHLPDSVIDLIRRSLQDETFVPVGDAFEIASSRAHGLVRAVSVAMRRLGFASRLAAKPCAERERVLAMVASRIVSQKAIDAMDQAKTRHRTDRSNQTADRTRNRIDRCLRGKNRLFLGGLQMIDLFQKFEQ